jgi:hypothetical protein
MVYTVMIPEEITDINEIKARAALAGSTDQPNALPLIGYPIISVPVLKTGEAVNIVNRGRTRICVSHEGETITLGCGETLAIKG